MAPLFEIEGIDFFSLQKIAAAEQIRNFSFGNRLIDHTESLANYADTAALISQLHLVISVDTSIAHVAAAMGKPVWLLLPFAPDWRWQLDRSDSPWYPTMRLFRQQARDDWPPVIKKLAAALTTGPKQTPAH